MPHDLYESDGSVFGSRKLRGFFAWLDAHRWAQVALILLAAALLCLPCLFHGLPPGTNAPTHVKYYHHFSAQFWGGEIYPRWLADENKGYGSPIFIAQYPLPYFLTALLRPFTSFPSDTRDARELGLFIYLAVAAAGLAARYWTGKFTRPLTATLAGIVYMALPYVLQDGVYGRDAIGELSTFVWIPLALSLSEAIDQWAAVCALSGVFALSLTSNFLSTAVFVPFLTGYAIFYGQRTGLSRLARAYRVCLAQSLGVGIAGLYVLPLLAYRHLFNLHQNEAVLPAYQFALYFLQITSRDFQAHPVAAGVAEGVLLAAVTCWYIWHVRGDVRIRIGMALVLGLGTLTLIPNLGPTLLGLSGFRLRPAPPDTFTATMCLGFFFSAALALLAYCRIAAGQPTHRTQLLLCVAALTFFLMLPFSAPIWRALPGSSAVQFPFRLGGVMSIAVAALVAIALDATTERGDSLRYTPSRLMIVVAAGCAVAGGFLTWRTDREFRHPTTTVFDVAGDVDPMYRAYVPFEHLFAFAESIGTTPRGYDVQPMPGDGTLRFGLTGGDCDLTVRREAPRLLHVSSDCKGEAHLRIGQLYSPLWRVSPVQGSSPGSILNASADGILEMGLPRGKQDVQLKFDLGAAERWGAVLSGASLVLMLLGFVRFRGTRQPLN
jgi:hypothetical protein